MQDIGIGLSIGLAFQGLASIKTCEASFKRLRKTINNTGDSVKSLKRDLAAIKLSRLKVEGIEKSMDDFKGKMMNKVALAGSVILPVKTAIDFEESMADVRKVVDFETKDELKKFGGEILALTREIPLSASELATITASGGQLGIAKENLLEFTTIAAKMGVAFDMGAGEAGDSMGKMMNIFGMDIKAVSSLGDAINHLSDNSASKANEIVQVLKRIGGTAKTIGLTAVQATSLASAFISLGKTPELAATSADTLMKKLGNIKEDKNMQETLAKLGMDPSYVAANMAKAPEQMIMMFLENVRGLKGQEQLKLLTNVFGDGFAGDIALLVNGLDTYKKAIKDVGNKEAYARSMDKEFKNKSDTTANALRTLKNAITEISINLGNLFLPAIARVARGIGAVLTPIANFINAHETLSKIIGAVGIGFVSFAVILPTIGFLFSGVVLTLTKMKMAFHLVKIAIVLTSNALKINTILTKTWTGVISLSSFAATAFSFTLRALGMAVLFTGSVFKGLVAIIKITSMALLTNPIGLILSGIALVAGLVITNWDKVKEWFGKFGSWIKGIFAPIIEWFSSKFGGLFDWISEKLSWVVNAAKKVGSFLGFGGEEEAKSEPKYNERADLQGGYFGINERAPATLGALASGGVININLNGGFNIATSNGKFDLSEFETALVSSVKRALAKDERNSLNTKVGEL